MKIVLICLLIGCAASFHLDETWMKVKDQQPPNKQAFPAKTYIVDLDLPPMERWNNLLQHFDANDIKMAFHSLINQHIHPKRLLNVLEMVAADLDHYIRQPFADEMRGVSKFLNMDLKDVVLTNIIYEVTAFNRSNIKACTSIVSKDKTGRIIHGRNLDYGGADLMKSLTVQVDYQKNGKSLFMTTTWAGYIGVITGTKHGAFSVSCNERNKGFLWENLLSALEDSWPAFFLPRMVLEEAKDYKSALNYLVKIPTISPVYYIVGGIRPGEGAIIVKNRRNVLNVTSMENNWFVLETNYDPWNKPPASDDRRDAGIAAMNKIGKDNMDPKKLYEALSVPLVLNNHTTYTTVMSAADSSVYRTMVRYDAPSDTEVN